MPVAVRISCQHMTREDYDRVIKDLEASGCGEPEGRSFHAAYGDDDVHMFEVWESEDHFDAHRERLMGALQGAGLDAGSVEVHPLHSDHPD
jgi:quinol monooxygenase YgiN